MEKSEINILIVDDSDYSRLTISKIVSSAGFNVKGETSSGKDAMKLLSDGSYHIAIIDVVMPDFNGIELAQAIGENFDHIHMIMVSSLDQEQVILESISKGAQDFLKKPIHEQALIESLNKIAHDMMEE